MEETKRLTVERANKIMKENDFRLRHGSWLPACNGDRSCCAAGLLLIEKDGYTTYQNDFISTILNSAWAEAIRRVIPGNVVLAERIADHVGVPTNYIFGLDKGFEGKSSFLNNFADAESEDFKQGLEDGQTLAALPGVAAKYGYLNLP